MYGQPAYGQPAYGAPPPGYGAPPPPVYYPPPQQQAQPTIITLGNQNQGGEGTMCPVCSHETGNLPRKTIGCVAITWCIVMLFTTGCCCIPLCMDGCKDTELVCVKCQTVKAKIPANCC